MTGFKLQYGWLTKLIKSFNTYSRFIIYLSLAVLSYQAYNDSSKIRDLQLKVQELQIENNRLLTDLVYYNKSFENHPWPIWSKVKRGDDFIMQRVNVAYYELWLKPKELSQFYYSGKTDFDIYNYSTAAIFYARDLSLAIDGGSWRGLEYIINDEDLPDESLQVLKWREIKERDTIIYGMVIPQKNIK